MLITQTISSVISKDSIIIKRYERSHKAYFILEKFDDFTENIKIINQTLEYLKSYDIKWIELTLGVNFKVPSNTVWFKNKKNGNINCHIEDFEQFYFANVTHIVKPRNLCVNNSVDVESNDDEEWTVVLDKKHVRKQKMNKIRKEVDSLLEDWNNL